MLPLSCFRKMKIQHVDHLDFLQVVSEPHHFHMYEKLIFYFRSKKSDYKIRLHLINNTCDVLDINNA